MLIRNVTEDKAINLLREWNGQTPGGKIAESERAFRAVCDRYVLVEVENAQELARLNTMEKYITGGHGFYLYVRYPADVLESIRAGRAALPEFVHRAEERYSSAYARGSLKLLIGFMQEALDPNYDIGLFIDIMGQQKKAQAKARQVRQAEPVYQPPVQPVAQPEPVYQVPVQPEPVYQAPVQPVYQQPAYQAAAYQQPTYQPQRRATNVVHYHFGNQVS